MGKIPAFGKSGDEEGEDGTLHKALRSDSARRGRGRENGLRRASLEAVGKISAIGKSGFISAFALGIRIRGVRKGEGLSPILFAFFSEISGM